MLFCGVWLRRVERQLEVVSLGFPDLPAPRIKAGIPLHMNLNVPTCPTTRPTMNATTATAISTNQRSKDGMTVIS
jgi:hypothetical protein